MLNAMTQVSEVRKAAMEVRNALTKDAVRLRCILGYPGWAGACTTCWSQRHRLWSVLYRGKTRYWYCFGDHLSPSGPAPGERLDIVCEINSPLEGINLRCAGAFRRTKNGAVVFTHSGKVGGGRKGIGKLAFLRAYPDRPIARHVITPSVRWSRAR